MDTRSVPAQAQGDLLMEGISDFSGELGIKVKGGVDPEQMYRRNRSVALVYQYQYQYQESSKL